MLKGPQNMKKLFKEKLKKEGIEKVTQIISDQLRKHNVSEFKIRCRDGGFHKEDPSTIHLSMIWGEGTVEDAGGSKVPIVKQQTDFKLRYNFKKRRWNESRFEFYQSDYREADLIETTLWFNAWRKNPKTKSIYRILNDWKIDVEIYTDIMIANALMEVDSENRRLKIQMMQDQDLKERVVTFFHEILHSDRDPRFNDLPLEQKKLYNKDDLGPNHLEGVLTEEAYHIYHTNPRLVRYVISKFGLDRDLPNPQKS